MAEAVQMPKVGNSVEECVLVAWKKAKGDSVKTGEIIAEIETDKATFEVESTAEGTMLGFFFEEGDLVPVFTNICAIGSEGDDIASLKPKPAKKAPAESKSPAPSPAPQQAAPSPGASQPSAATATASAVQQQAPAEAAAAAVAEEIAYSPRARKFMKDHGFTAELARGSGPHGRIVEADVKEAWFGAPRYSSLAKALMADGHTARVIPGSGINGMVLARDLGPAPSPLSTLRNTISRRMHESLATTAQFTMNASARADGLLALRKKIKPLAEKKALPNITINDMLNFATVKTLMEFPAINAEFLDGKLYQHDRVHFAFACDTPRGLVVPVIRDADSLSLSELAVRARELQAVAVSGSISPDDITGGTFTISNLGTFGIESFTPILNLPQVAILGVCTITPKPVRVKGAIEYIDHIGLSLTVNHQMVDGAPAAAFMKRLIQQIAEFDGIHGLQLD
jgi:pyruvate dehydrogenase E2 component (dihydrolipoamide acetyltransferase)